jgi:hypothetical protein
MVGDGAVILEQICLIFLELRGAVLFKEEDLAVNTSVSEVFLAN